MNNKSDDLIHRMDEPLSKPFIDIYDRGLGTLDSIQLKEIDSFLCGGIKERIFIYHLLNCLNTLPSHYLPLLVTSLIGFDSSINLLSSVFANLRRIFGFIAVEREIQKSYVSSRVWIEKYFISLFFSSNTIDFYFEFAQGKIEAKDITYYEWDKTNFKSKWKLSSEEELNYLSQQVTSALNSRYELVLSDYLKDDTPFEVLRSLVFLIPDTVDKYDSSFTNKIKLAEIKTRRLFPDIYGT